MSRVGTNPAQSEYLGGLMGRRDFFPWLTTEADLQDALNQISLKAGLIPD